jgi:hypothetical protein
MPLATGSPRKDDRDRPGFPLEGTGSLGPACQDGVGLQTDQLMSERSYPIDVTAAPTKIHPYVAAIDPTQVRKRLNEREVATLPVKIIIFIVRHEHADAP